MLAVRPANNAHAQCLAYSSNIVRFGRIKIDKILHLLINKAALSLSPGRNNGQERSSLSGPFGSLLPLESSKVMKFDAKVDLIGPITGINCWY